MRRLLLIIIAIVLLASIFGVYKAFTLPTEIEEQIAVFNYEHQGEFDYLVHLKGSYLFDDIPLETGPKSPESPPSKPKYPTEIIDRIDITFTYWFAPDKPVTGLSEQVEVTALLVKPTGREEIILVPTEMRTGKDLTVNFSLDASELASISTITITASVYTTIETDTGPIFESFTQSLAMRSKGPLLEVDTGLRSTQSASFSGLNYKQTGEFDYSVVLKALSPFPGLTLKPPSVTPPPPPTTRPSSKTLGPGEAIFLKLFDGMDITFSYHLESDWPAREIAEEVEINAVLENPGVWSKTVVLVPPTKKSGDFTVTFPLDPDDFSHFSDIFKTIEKETGVSVPDKLTIKADVHTVAQTAFGPIDEKFSQTLSTTLGGNVLEWEEELADSKPGTIETSRMIPNPDKFVGLSISAIRNLSAIVAGVIFILFLYLLVLNVWSKPEKLSLIEQEALQARKKHKDVIVDVEELPEAEAEEMVVSLSSLNELVKAADALLKPVLHKAEPEKHIYCVIDTMVRYQYVSELASKDKLTQMVNNL